MPHVPRPRTSQLIHVAERLLDSEGPHALSLRRIADAAGTSTQSVYTEFGGKHGLTDVLFRSGFRRLADHLSGLSLPDEPIERIVVLGRGYRAVARAHPHHYALMTGRPVPEYRPTADSLSFAAATIEPLRAAVEWAVDVGALHGDAAEITEALWAAGHGYVSLENSGLVRANDERFERYLRGVIRTWAPRGG